MDKPGKYQRLVEAVPIMASLIGPEWLDVPEDDPINEYARGMVEYALTSIGLSTDYTDAAMRLVGLAMED